jgi:hypothetical protein
VTDVRPVGPDDPPAVDERLDYRVMGRQLEFQRRI